MIDYSTDIYNILLQAPNGLPIRKIVRHVYNANTTLFDTIDIEDVKRNVTAFLARKSKTKSSPIERTDVRGVYRLNPNSMMAQQLMLNFQDDVTETEAEETKKPEIENTIPGLFDEMY